ncbi:MAG TPA: ATP-binding protein, partial [Myxococcaceae bacterium]|nr:ATP-binding protein [Myxococcaceae bacterium]
TRWWTLSRETQETLQRDISRAARGEFVRHDVEVYGTAQGSETLIADFSLNPVVDHTGTVVFLLAEGRNITEKKRAEVELARKNQELEKLLSRVRELSELRSQLCANVSHELRTPLALILGPVERLLAEATHLTESQRRDLDVIRRNAATLLKHVNELLDVSKLEAGGMEPRYTEVDLARLVHGIASHFEALATQRDISYVVDLPPRLPAQVDPEKLERALLNLLSNAFKFTPSGGRVKLSLHQTEQGCALLAVQDSGPGVPPELRRRIFERFQQGEGGATRQFGGTGLGLSIARDFIQLHGGTLTVTDAPAGGALFLAEVPRVAPAGVRVRPATEVPSEADSSLLGTLEELRPVTVAPPAVRQGEVALPRLLLVEDHPEMRRFVAESLAADFQVSTASDGQAGLEQALAHPPDLIVTDLMMPRMSGEQMTRELRRHRALDDVPVLVLSAREDDPLRLRLLSQGAQDYVTKPFSAAELRARARNLVQVKRVRELLRSELASQQEDLEALAREVTARGRELSLALEAMRAAREQAERASEIKSIFMSLVSHELRTPLTALQLQLERLRRDKTEPLSERQAWRVQRLVASSRRLRELVDSLLEYTRLDSGRLLLQPATFHPAALAAEAVEELRPLAEQKGLRLELDADEAGFTSDPRLVRLILVNLVGNAIKFTDQGQVRVTLRLEEGVLRLVVRDT